MTRSINMAGAAALAAAVTFVLFFLMQWMLAADGTVPERGERRLIGDISIPELPVVINKVSPRPPEPILPEELPELPRSVLAPLQPGPLIPTAEAPVIGGGGIEDTVLVPSDSDFLPIVTVKPQYPQRALLREIEGWCLVSFTVDETGAVVDPVVVDADPPREFDAASLRAISRFKFNPRVENGVAVRSAGVQYLFTYTLAE